MSDTAAAKNTDREIWRGPDDGNGSFYADSIRLIEGGGIGIDCGGHVIVRHLREWHALAIATTRKPVAFRVPRVIDDKLSKTEFRLFNDENEARLAASDIGADYDGLYLVADRRASP